MLMVALPLVALRLTRNPLLIAGLAATEQSPAILLSLVAGVVVDRVDRRRVMVWSSAVSAMVLGLLSGLFALGSIDLPALYVGGFVLNAGNLAFALALQACVPEVAGEDGAEMLYSRVQSATLAGEQFVGPAVSGILLSLRTWVPFVGDALSFLGGLALVRRAVPPGRPASAGTHFRADLRAGVVWFVRHRVVWLLAASIAALAFCQSMVIAMRALYFTRSLGASASDYGIIIALASLGGLVGSAISGRVARRLGPARSIILAGALTAASYSLLSFNRLVTSAVALVALEEAAVAIGNVASLSLRSRVIPDELRGRVGAALRMAIYGVIPLGALAGGAIAEGVGVRASLAVAGGLQFVALVVVSPALVRALRSIPSAPAGSPEQATADAINAGAAPVRGRPEAAEADGSGSPIHGLAPDLSAGAGPGRVDLTDLAAQPTGSHGLNGNR